MLQASTTMLYRKFFATFLSFWCCRHGKMWKCTRGHVLKIEDNIERMRYRKFFGFFDVVNATIWCNNQQYKAMSNEYDTTWECDTMSNKVAIKYDKIQYAESGLALNQVRSGGIWVPVTVRGCGIGDLVRFGGRRVGSRDYFSTSCSSVWVTEYNVWSDNTCAISTAHSRFAHMNSCVSDF